MSNSRGRGLSRGRASGERSRAARSRGGVPGEGSFQIATGEEAQPIGEPRTPGPLELPKPGSATHMPPPTSTSRSTSAASPRPSSGSPVAAQSPRMGLALPIGSAAQSDEWIYLKQMESLSISERAIHNNLAVIADRLDRLTEAFIQSRAGKSFETSPAAVQKDQTVVAELDDEKYTNLLSDQLNDMKTACKDSTLSSRTNDKARNQANDLMERLQKLAEEVGGEEVLEGEESGGTEAEKSMAADVYDLASKLSASGRVTWYLKLVKRFGLGYKKPTESAKNKGKGKARRTADNDDEDDGDEVPRDEDENEWEGGADNGDDLEDAGRAQKKRKRN